jgi:hypothetical protein
MTPMLELEADLGLQRTLAGLAGRDGAWPETASGLDGGAKVERTDGRDDSDG